jgi:hypothetical protein
MNQMLRDIVLATAAAGAITAGYCGMQNYEHARDEQRAKAALEAKLQEEEKPVDDLLNKIKSGDIPLYRVIIPKNMETGFGVDHIYYSETAGMKDAPSRDTFRRVFQLLNYDTMLAAKRAYYIPDMLGDQIILGMTTTSNPNNMSQTTYDNAMKIKETKEKRDKDMQASMF